ncbi:VQ motif-containing protein 4-like [Phragmites australis]|uniref:VQ motif-containing protein 4-like n=1 Tax=Phragmites australis TaxID=29695 RepID=UPI002D787D0C|nr:VQ motif-containing protein 4-like [Phragmites australis]
MEVSTKQLLPMTHQQDPNSPSYSTSSSSSSSTSPSHPYHRAQPHNLPPSPRPVPRTIDTTPFPTTFVQADTSSFKQVVQMLTGAEQPAKNDATTATAGNSGNSGTNGAGQATSGPCRPKKPSFKLYERRSSLKNLKMIAPLAMGPPPSPRRPSATPEILSPSVLDFPSLRLSPVTPLTGDLFNRSPASSSSEEAERAAIAERGFFLHPSPRGAEPPRLLPLFPVTSPRMAASAAAPSE